MIDPARLTKQDRDTLRELAKDPAYLRQVHADFANPDFVKDGMVTEAGLQQLSEKLPHADLAKFAEDPQVSHIQDLFTVQLLVRFVEAKLLVAV